MKIYQGTVYDDFLDKNKQQYKIPVYQRNYEWSWEQCDKLFEDIVLASKRREYHFCGSIVHQPIDPNKGINTSIIIDGQQRLTTIYILIKSLLDCAQDDVERELPLKALFNTDPFGQYDLDDLSKVKLKAAKENNDQLLALLYDKNDKLDKNCEIYRNYAHFCELIKKEQVQGTTVKDIMLGINYLMIAVVVLKEADNAQEIFERINSTGIPLTLADKIRNYVLMTDKNQDELYDKYWLVTEKLLSKEQLGSFFLDYLNFKQDGFTREDIAYDDFKRIYVDGKYDNEKMLAEILHYAKQYHTFIHGDGKLGSEINQSLTGLRRLGQTTVYLFLFHVFDDYENGIIDQQELGKVLRFLLNYSIRRLICEIGSNSLRGLYKSLYSRAFSQTENKDHYYDALVCFMRQITSKDAVPSETDFELALKERNLYRKNALCKYLLAAIENQGKEKIVTDNLSIEHIMPQNKNLSTSWQKMLGDDWEAVRDRYLHTLGNLALTGYNSELGDLPFKDKKEKLEENPTHITILYSDVMDKDVWNAQNIEARADRLAKIIRELFPIDDPEVRIDFYDPRYKEYTVANPDEATYKYVNYYELLGERVTVDSFAAMIHSVAAKLYDMDSSIICRMAEKLEKLPGWQVPVFAYDKSAIREPEKLKKDADVYFSTRYSARDCIYFIRGLMKAYNLDLEEDFVYSARPASSAYNNLNNNQIIKDWCVQQAQVGSLMFDPRFSTGKYMRYTTLKMNCLLPENVGKLSAWGSKNYYFYEIIEDKGKLFTQMAVYCRSLSDELRKACTHMSDILGKGPLPNGYIIFFKTDPYTFTKDDTEQDIVAVLNSMFETVTVFEEAVLEKWNATGE